MGLRYENLDAATRGEMANEIGRDIGDGTFYASSYFLDGVEGRWRELVTQAGAEHNDDWLVDQINAAELLKTHAPRKAANGGVTLVKVPHTAAMTLGEGQFNQFYIRALCLRALAEGLELEVYRAKDVADPRDDAHPIGSRVDPAATLAELRETKGVNSKIAQPNSGRCVRLVKK